MPQFVLFSLKIDDFDCEDDGRVFVNSGTFCCFAADCELTFHGHASGGALHSVSYKQQ